MLAIAAICTERGKKDETAGCAVEMTMEEETSQPQSSFPTVVSARHQTARGVWKQRQENRIRASWGGPSHPVGGDIWAPITSSSSSSRSAGQQWGGWPTTGTFSTTSQSPAPAHVVSLNVNSFLMPI